ncbi:hypothetical protein L6164_031598 [Bauhinia variegata]|uniref:Uncharacterized protein n=1 Tax=Bauhinia variegata TaxID=167791 RepID=A0ACB9LFI5_BAUVA|nr:hypothetical protein L6164_031598 [Bauhinia variegata]
MSHVDIYDPFNVMHPINLLQGTNNVVKIRLLIKKGMGNQTGQPRPPPSSTTSNVAPADQDHQQSPKGRWRSKFETFAGRLLEMDNEKWLDNIRGSLSTVAALICTITFQSAINPPGGVVHTSTRDSYTRIDCNSAT